MKFEYQEARIASVTRVTNLTQNSVLAYDGNTKFTRPQSQTPYKMSKEQRKRHNMAEHERLYPGTPYVPPVQQTAPVRDSTGAPVVNKVNTARKNLRKNFNKFNKIAVSNGVTNITIERWLATKLMKNHEEKNKPDMKKTPVFDWVNSHSTVAPKYYKEAVELLGPAKEGQAPRTPGTVPKSKTKNQNMNANGELLQDGSDGEFHVGGHEAHEVESEDEDVDSKFKV